MEKELIRFVVKHNEKLDYSTIDIRAIWYLLCMALKGWQLKITSVKAIDREEHFITISGNRLTAKEKWEAENKD